MRRVLPRIEKGPRRAVIAHIRVLAVVSTKSRRFHDKALRIARRKTLPAFHPARQGLKLNPRHFTNNANPCRLLPPAFALTIIHYHIRSTQLPRDPKREHLPPHAAIKAHSRVTERAKRHSHRHAAHLVIHNFVPHQIAQRIGARLAQDLQRDHSLACAKPALRPDRFKRGVNERRNAVPAGSARHNLNPVFNARH